MITHLTLPPPPDGQVLSLVAALSNAQDHELHVQAIRARDEALSSSNESYGALCTQLAYLLSGSDRPQETVARIDPVQWNIFQQSDPRFAEQLRQASAHPGVVGNPWIAFGQMAGLILKQALLHPPYAIIEQRSTQLFLVSPASQRIQEVLLFCLGCSSPELRNVASTVLATTSVGEVQPSLNLNSSPQILSYLVEPLKDPIHASAERFEGSMSTIRKMMEDGPNVFSITQLDNVIQTLLALLVDHKMNNAVTSAALQAIVSCLTANLFPSALVARFEDYLSALSRLAVESDPEIRKWVCRSIVTLLSLRTEYLQPHLPAICQFMLTCTADKTNPDVALEACEFWLTFASLDEDVCNPAMLETVELLLPHLVPILLRGMVYLPDQQEELVYRNFVEHLAASTSEAIGHKPVFHKVKSKGQKAESYDDDDDEDDDFDDDEGNSWTLRKCSAASLDCLSNLYGGEEILPALLPGLQEGFSSSDPWVQEASILALGAVAEGCGEAMGTQHMSQLYPYLMELLQSPEGPGMLPQVKCIAAWTMGRYSSWAVKQVQSGAQHDLLAQITETLLVRMGDTNEKTQVSCCSALGVMIEHAGDLMIPYLEPTLQALTNALKRYDGRALLNLFDVFGIMADSVGPAIGEGRLPAIYIPSLLQMWDFLANQDPSDRRIIPLLECLASITMNCGNNYQPYALETFDNAMAMIESISLDLSTTGESIENDEDADPIVCAADILDGLVEGLGSNFSNLVASSSRYGGVFSNVILGLTQHEVPGVRMSAFAIVGDLARRAPTVLEAGLHEFLKASTLNLDTVHPSVCNNAVWAIGEICVRCQGNSAPLVPIAPTLVQHLIGLLMGNGVSAGGVGIVGLPENAATAMGRLAKVDPSFVASDLPRFLTGWCDAMARIRDVGERRDAFQGFINAVYANPSAISVASQNQPVDSISSVLFAVVSWHMPEDLQGIGISSVQFLPFPSAEAELGESLRKLLQDIKQSLGEDTWRNVETKVPVNVRQLLRMVYHV